MEDRFFNVFKKEDNDELPIFDIHIEYNPDENSLLYEILLELSDHIQIGAIDYAEEIDHPEFDYEVYSDKGTFLLKECHS